MSSPTCCHKDPPLTLAPPPPRQAYDPRLELDLGGGVGQVHLVHAWLGTMALKCKAPSISSRAAEERDGWMGGKRSSGGKDTWGRVPVVGRPARQPPGRGGVGWRQGCFTPLRQSPVGRGFNHGARRDCREVHARGGSQHFYRRRIVACWHIVTCHHAARGRSTLLDPGLRGLRTGPILPVAPRTRRHQPGRGGGDLEDGGGRWRGAGPRPPHLAAAAAGLLQPRGSLGLQRAAAGGGGGGGGGGPCRGGDWEGWQVGRKRKAAS